MGIQSKVCGVGTIKKNNIFPCFHGPQGQQHVLPPHPLPLVLLDYLALVVVKIFEFCFLEYADNTPSGA